MSLFESLSVSSSGMTAQRARAEVIVQNLANAETTRTRDGGPYQRRDVVFESSPQASPFSAVFQNEMDQTNSGVRIADVVVDEREPMMRYKPDHPHADARGYVSYPNISPAEEMVDLMGASRGYQANVAAFSAIRDMVNKSIDLMR